MKVSYFYNPILEHDNDLCSIDIYMYKNGRSKVIKTLTRKYEDYWILLRTAKRMVEYMNINFKKSNIFNQERVNGLEEYLTYFY